MLFQVCREVSEPGVDLGKSEVEFHISKKKRTNLIILDPVKNNKRFLRWLPGIGIMVVIFGLSSIPSRELPNFGWLDFIIKKGAHMLGYGFLAAAYWYGMRFDNSRWWLALVLAVVYAITDEFHQSFVPGRHPSWVDALVIDGGGAVLSLLAVSGIRKRMR
jgi:VanZ family protein